MSHDQSDHASHSGKTLSISSLTMSALHCMKQAQPVIYLLAEIELVTVAPLNSFRDIGNKNVL